jgi:hypothetical protein
MKLPFAQVLLLLAAFVSPTATAKPTPFLDNFRVVLDNKKSYRSGRGLSKLSDFDVDAKAIVENVRREATEIGEKLWTEANVVFDKVQTEAKEMVKHLEDYSKVEIGAYAALALSLTVAMKGK